MDRLKGLLSEILKIDPADITRQTSPDNVPSWDSFNGLLIASRLEDVFKVNFTIDEVKSVKKAGDIIEILKKHGIVLDGEVK